MQLKQFTRTAVLNGGLLGSWNINGEVSFGSDGYSVTSSNSSNLKNYLITYHVAGKKTYLAVTLGQGDNFINHP